MKKALLALLCITTAVSADRTYFLPGYDQPDQCYQETCCDDYCDDYCDDGYCDDYCCDSCWCDSPWYSYLEGRGRYGDWREGGGLDLFVPVINGGDQVVYSQSHLYRLKHQWAASTGLGFRRVCSSCLGMGLNVFYDYAHSDNGFNYSQIGAGAEIFGACWEARGNVYLPLSGKTQGAGEGQAQEYFLNGVDLFAQFDRPIEYAYRGVDGELGYIACLGCSTYLRGYVGGFYFNTKDTRDLAGPRLRAVIEKDNILCCGSRIFAGAEWQYDRVRKTQASVTAGIRIPLGGCAPCCYNSSLCRRVTDLVHREPGVVLTRTYDRPIDDIQVFFVDATGGGIGTQTDPTTIADAVARSGPRDVIFGLINGGDIPTTGPFTLSSDQQLLGFGDGTSRVIDFGGGATVQVDGSGRATFAATNANDLFILGDNNNVCGLRFTGGGSTLVGDGITAGRGEDNIFDGVTTALDITNAAGFFDYTDLEILNTTGPAITLANNADHFSLRDSTLTDGLGQVVIYDAGGRFTWDNVQTTNFDVLAAGTNGVEFLNPNGDIRIVDSRFEEVGAPAGSANAVVNVTSTADTFNFESLRTTVSNTTAAASFGYDFDIAGATTATLAVLEGTVEGTTSGVGYAPLAAAGSDLDPRVTDTTITPTTGTAITYAASGDNSGMVVDMDFSRNAITSGGNAVLVISSAVNGTRDYLTGRIDDNTIASSAGIVVVPVFTTNSLDFMGLGIERNTFTGVTGSVITVLNLGSGTLDTFVANNTDDSVAASPVAYSAANFAFGGATKQTCTTFLNNNTGRTLGLNVNRQTGAAAGTMTVPGAVSAATLSALNNNIPATITDPDAAILTGACPPPPAPPM